ncbi:cysteine desulfurase family protein [Clostridium algidicarnis]|uniref:Cysteine desulfurase n=2 Tax=Clostridium algidicarnis TaxID=37659 RepID=A0A2S6FWB4_9CLOT|nr:cysteine desulfurase family protein [Clostridium algidicarnis]MBB6631983.1 cysteine desulfurase [Clostridium algidicarnis]MBU3194612.1 cysteine desulfurase [Clostridium algidicarnis]MBU3202617.1 cysteine desulfurase [Clostridium algidicarnis]MBU3206913.1 cysteine desulfurase [Clostridium algidicarnis]MBU3210771.1 cysteine desulfurase [Clostridium algidicarnis]
MEIYLDNSATTKPYDEVTQILVSTMKEVYGNPSSSHKLGVMAEKKLNEARDTISHTINCSKEEIIFTSGGSESNNLAIKGFVKPGNHIITCATEHSSVSNTIKEMERQGVKVTYLSLDTEGKIDLEELKNSINKDTVLVSLMHVNNETGIIQDLKSIGNIIKEKSHRAKFHVDSVQGFGKLKINVKECNIDLLSASGHKIHAPRGVGFLYIKNQLRPKPLIEGGGQEKGFRAGTENVASIVALALASKMMNDNIKENYIKVNSVKAYFIEKLKEFEGVRINSPLKDEFSPYILNVSFKDIKGEVLLHALEDDDIYVSTGSACSSKNSRESRILKALLVPNDYLEGAIRFSFSEFTTKDEIDYTLQVLKKSLGFLRRVKI